MSHLIERLQEAFSVIEQGKETDDAPGEFTLWLQVPPELATEALQDEILHWLWENAGSEHIWHVNSTQPEAR